MSVIVKVAGGIVETRYKDVSTPEAAAARYGGEASDYLIGNAFPGDVYDFVTGEFTTPPQDAANLRAQISQEITAEQARRRLISVVKIPMGPGQLVEHAIDAAAITMCKDFNVMWDRGTVPAAIELQLDAGAMEMPSPLLRVVSLAVEEYLAMLPPASTGVHKALASTADEDLSNFNYSNDAYWPASVLVIDPTNVPEMPVSWETKLAELRAEIEALKAS